MWCPKVLRLCTVPWGALLSVLGLVTVDQEQNTAQVLFSAAVSCLRDVAPLQSPMPLSTRPTFPLGLLEKSMCVSFGVL